MPGPVTPHLLLLMMLRILLALPSPLPYLILCAQSPRQCLALPSILPNIDRGEPGQSEISQERKALILSFLLRSSAIHPSHVGWRDDMAFGKQWQPFNFLGRDFWVTKNVCVWPKMCMRYRYAFLEWGNGQQCGMFSLTGKIIRQWIWSYISDTQTVTFMFKLLVLWVSR